MEEYSDYESYDHEDAPAMWVYDCSDEYAEVEDSPMKWDEEIDDGHYGIRDSPTIPHLQDLTERMSRYDYDVQSKDFSDYDSQEDSERAYRSLKLPCYGSPSMASRYEFLAVEQNTWYSYQSPRFHRGTSVKEQEAVRAEQLIEERRVQENQAAVSKPAISWPKTTMKKYYPLAEDYVYSEVWTASEFDDPIKDQSEQDVEQIDEIDELRMQMEAEKSDRQEDFARIFKQQFLELRESFHSLIEAWANEIEDEGLAETIKDSSGDDSPTAIVGENASQAPVEKAPVSVEDSPIPASGDEFEATIFGKHSSGKVELNLLDCLKVASETIVKIESSSIFSNSVADMNEDSSLEVESTMCYDPGICEMFGMENCCVKERVEEFKDHVYEEEFGAERGDGDSGNDFRCLEDSCGVRNSCDMYEAVGLRDKLLINANVENYTDSCTDSCEYDKGFDPGIYLNSVGRYKSIIPDNVRPVFRASLNLLNNVSGDFFYNPTVVKNSETLNDENASFNIMLWRKSNSEPVLSSSGYGLRKAGHPNCGIEELDKESGSDETLKLYLVESTRSFDPGILVKFMKCCDRNSSLMGATESCSKEFCGTGQSLRTSFLLKEEESKGLFAATLLTNATKVVSMIAAQEDQSMVWLIAWRTEVEMESGSLFLGYYISCLNKNKHQTYPSNCFNFLIYFHEISRTNMKIRNCLNSKINKVYVLTQFNSASPNRHLSRAYASNMGGYKNEGFVEVLQAQQSPENPDWFQDTVDAVRQYTRMFEEHNILEYLILAGDHLYRMDYERFIQTDESTKSEMEGSHQGRGDNATLSALDEDDFKTLTIENKLGCEIFSKRVQETSDRIELLLENFYQKNLGNFFCALRIIRESQEFKQQKLFPQSVRTKCVKPLIERSDDVFEGTATWTIVGVIGNIIAFFLFLFLSPAPTFLQIFKKKSVEQFSPVPYLATFINCMLWVLYGLPWVHPNSILVITINGTGFFMEVAYLMLFITFSKTKKDRMKLLFIMLAELLFVGVLALLVLISYCLFVCGFRNCGSWFIFEVPQKGSAKLEMEVTNPAAKA